MVGRKGAAISAIGGIDIALWDLKGKLEGNPYTGYCGGGTLRSRLCQWPVLGDGY